MNRHPLFALSPRARWASGALGAALTLSLFGCDAASPSVSGDDLSSSAALVLSYDETETISSPLWAGELVDGSSKGRDPSTSTMLLGYRKAHVTVGIGRDGASTVDYLITDGFMGMPDDLYENVKGEMPAPDPGFDPLARIVKAKGLVRLYGKSGKKLMEMPAPEEGVETEASSLLGRTSTDAATRRTTTLTALRQSGLQFQLQGNRMVIVHEKPSQQEAAQGTASVDVVYDLELGATPIRTALRDQQGRFQMVELRQVALHDGYPVVLNKETYLFSDTEGGWDVTRRIVVNRSNVRIETR